MCDCSFLDMPTVFNSRTHKARLKHVCDECRRIIQPGETYRCAFGVWYGEAKMYKTCAHCLAAQKALGDLLECHCWAFGDFLNDLYERARYYPKKVPGQWFRLCRLAVWMERGWLASGKADDAPLLPLDAVTVVPTPARPVSLGLFA